MKKYHLITCFCLMYSFTSFAQNYCDSIEIQITNQSLTSITCTSSTSGLNTFWTSQDWILTDKYGITIGSVSGSNASFSMPNPMNSDTNYICLTSILSAPALTIACNTCDTVIWNGTSWMLLSMMPPPCNLTGGSVYIDHTSGPWMMNASVNGMSIYTYSWTDTNGLVVGTSNQIPFYTQWCLTITDNITGCDTTICQGCMPDSSALCACPMIYMPVCGCDGNQYPNSCVADCAGVGWTPAVSSGIPGGFLPCAQANPCTVEINNGTIDIEICDGDTAILEATSGFDTYTWTSTGSSLGSSHILYATNPGIYIVVATDVQNNCVDMDSIEVIVYPSSPLNPITAPNPPMICLGDSIIIEVNAGFINYGWNTGNPLDQGEDRVVVYPTQDFTYVVEALDINGCESREEIQVYVDTCATNIQMNILDRIQIYPNPSNKDLFIKLPAKQIADIYLYDIEGRLIIEKLNKSSTVLISNNNLKKGVYIIRVENHLGCINKRIMFN